MTRLAPLILLLAALARADTIELRRTAESPETGVVRLADVADLRGPAAEALAELVLIEDANHLPTSGEHARHLDINLVRDRIDDAPGVNWAFLTLRGSGVRLLTRAPALTSAAPEAADREDPTEPVAFEPAPGTIGALARDVLLRLLRVEPADLRVRWPDADRDLLEQPVSGRLIHVQPLGSSSRMPLTITIYEGDRLMLQENVRAEIRVRRPVHVLSRAVLRRTKLTEADVTSRVMWLEPGVAPAREVRGQVTTRRLEPGSVVEVDDIAPPLVVERGEIIQLHCIAGAVVLKTEARALANGREGEVIEVEMTSTGKRTTARMNGRGKAVMLVPTMSAAAGPAEDPEEGES